MDVRGKEVGETGISITIIRYWPFFRQFGSRIQNRKLPNFWKIHQGLKQHINTGGRTTIRLRGASPRNRVQFNTGQEDALSSLARRPSLGPPKFLSIECLLTFPKGKSERVWSLTILVRLWSNGLSSCLQIQRSRARFPALPEFLKNSGSGTGSTQAREDN
jgi:hypothetical protein